MLNNGDVFAGFTIERLLGQGGMGSVYLARHPRLGRLTALKLLNRELFADREIRARFEREADLVAQLDHPNIVEVYDRGTEDEQLWISMQFIDGVDAAGVNVTLLPPERAVQIIEGVAAALDYAHTRGVLHRDVKPANIILARAVAGHGERVFLTDFGIARLREDSTHLTQAGMFTATLAYASPEQMTGQHLDHTTDQYSLACALYWLLIGAGPYDSPHPAELIRGHLQLLPPPVSLRRPGLTQAMDAVLTKAMAKRPIDRFPSCTDFAKAARRALTTPAYPNQPAPHPSSPPAYPAAPAYAVPPAAYPAAPYPPAAPPQPYPAPAYPAPAQPYPADPSTYAPAPQPAAALPGYPAPQQPTPQPAGYTTPPPHPNTPTPQLVTPLPPASPSAPVSTKAQPEDTSLQSTDSFPTRREPPESAPPDPNPAPDDSTAARPAAETAEAHADNPPHTADSEAPLEDSPRRRIAHPDSPPSADPFTQSTDSFPTHRESPESAPQDPVVAQQTAEISSAGPDSGPEVQADRPAGLPSPVDLSSRPTDSFPTRREPSATGPAPTPPDEVSSPSPPAQPSDPAGPPQSDGPASLTGDSGPSPSSEVQGEDSSRQQMGSTPAASAPESAQPAAENGGGADSEAEVRGSDPAGYPGAGLRNPESGAFVPSAEAGSGAARDADSVWSREGAGQAGIEVGPVSVGEAAPVSPGAQFGPPPGYPVNGVPPQQVPAGGVQRSQVTALVVLGLAAVALLLMLALVVVQVAG